MSHSKALFASPRFLSHPVTQALGLSPADVTEKPSAELDRSSLVIVDCRQTAPGDLAGNGLSQAALDGGKTVLFLDPGTPHLEALRETVSGCPEQPQAALAVQGRTNPSGGRDFDVDGLGHLIVGAPGEEKTADSRFPRSGDAESSHCRCTPSGRRSPLALSPESLDGFVSRLRRKMDGKASPAQDSTIPTGLKYFQQNVTQSYSFTYQSASYTQPGAGALSLSWSVWGFLSQSQTANSQILIVQAAYSLNPGTLIANNDEDRGFVNSYLNASANPGGFAAYQYQPTSACDSWSGTVTIPISYLSPTGGYQIYTFEASVNNSVGSWCVQNISSGSSQGSQWYMNSPCNGADVRNDWENAFDWTGKVESMPSASTGTLSVNAVSAWNTSSLKTGYVSVPATLQWEGDHFYSSSCGLIGCYKINCGFSPKSWYPSWSFNFAPLNPS